MYQRRRQHTVIIDGTTPIITEAITITIIIGGITTAIVTMATTIGIGPGSWGSMAPWVLSVLVNRAVHAELTSTAVVAMAWRTSLRRRRSSPVASLPITILIQARRPLATQIRHNESVQWRTRCLCSGSSHPPSNVVGLKSYIVRKPKCAFLRSHF